MTSIFLCTMILAFSCGVESKKDNVILIIIDTLRADHLGCYGYYRETTPTIDSIAENGVRYLNVTAVEPWTLPSMVSIFSGLLPLEHSAMRHGDTYFGIDPAITTVSEFLNKAGYTTAAFFNVAYMSADFGFHQGFDLFDCFSSLGNCNPMGSSEDRNAQQTVDAVLEWLERGVSNDPIFLAVHFFDPHLTYSPPDSFADIWRNLEYSGEYDSSWGLRETVVSVNSGERHLTQEDLYNLEALYDGEIAYTDSEISRLLSALRDHGITENALVIIVSDHGEAFLEHGKLGHANSLYQELLSVPLIISGTGFEPGTESAINVSHADVLPTILAWVGEPIPENIFGLPLLADQFPEERSVPSGMNMYGEYVVTVRRNNLKLHLFNKGSLPFMFDLDSDPGEQMNLGYIDSTLLDQAQFYLTTPHLFFPVPVQIGDVILDALQNLGYI